MDVLYLSDNLREADRLEVEAGGRTPFEALNNGYERSEFLRTITYNGKPCGMVGIGFYDLPDLADMGCVWMLGTDDLTANPRRFLEACRAYLPDLFIKPVLCNYVWAQNDVHIRYLEWMGAEFDLEPEIINGQEYYYFEMRYNV